MKLDILSGELKSIRDKLHLNSTSRGEQVALQEEHKAKLQKLKELQEVLERQRCARVMIGLGGGPFRPPINDQFSLLERRAAELVEEHNCCMVQLISAQQN
jgi:hypothetical protein